MLENGFGEHNIQGIGDKHIPLIHNVMNTDIVVAVSDRSTDELGVVLDSQEGREYLVKDRGVDRRVVDALSSLGLSSICNVVAAIKIARRLRLGPADAIVTVATDGAEMYATERQKAIGKHFAGRFDRTRAIAAFAEHMLGAAGDHLLELSDQDRRRIFNLGYFTWVEQQGVSFEEFVARRDQQFWLDLRTRLPRWDAMIDAFNQEVGASAAIA
jgi:hypothetical protein